LHDGEITEVKLHRINPKKSAVVNQTPDPRVECPRSVAVPQY
jgi:hypothetical protein